MAELHEQIKNAIEFGTPKPEIPDYIKSNLKYSFFDWQEEAFQYMLLNENKIKEKNKPTHLMFNMATGTAVGAGKFLMYGQAGNDVLTGTAGDNIIDGGAGADTITTGNGADHVVLRSGDGGSTLAAADTLTDFSNGTDKFLLAGSLSFSDLTITSDANNTASTVISITDTSEYLITITDVAYGYITSNDFVTVPEIA